MPSQPTIVVFDLFWQRTAMNNEHLIQLQQVVGLDTIVHGFGHFVSDSGDEGQRLIRPMTTSVAIANLRPAVIILDPMLAVEGGMLDFNEGIRLYIWLKLSLATRLVPVIIVTDAQIPEDIKQSLIKYSAPYHFVWSDLLDRTGPLSTMIKRYLELAKR